MSIKIRVHHKSAIVSNYTGKVNAVVDCIQKQLTVYIYIYIYI